MIVFVQVAGGGAPNCAQREDRSMVIKSSGYMPGTAHLPAAEGDARLFQEHFRLLLRNEPAILATAEYFFAQPSFAFCSFPYVVGDGPLFVGYLLLGWKNNLLIGSCKSCDGRVIVTSFGGSVLSGSNSWSGLCTECETFQRGNWESDFHSRVKLIWSLRNQYPFTVRVCEEFEDNVFCWAGLGTQKGIKKRFVEQKLVEAVPFEVLVAELESGDLRVSSSPNVSNFDKRVQLKFDARPEKSIELST